MMMGVSYAMAVRHKFPVETAFQLRRVAETFKDSIWALSLPIIILGGIFTGWVTATEGAGLAVVAAIFIGGVIYRELDWRRHHGRGKRGRISFDLHLWNQDRP